jgi:hypothetical protein
MVKRSTSLVIFANFRIDNTERYLRMQDSFLSFKDISAEKWVINIRGLYKEEAFHFLQGHLKNKLYNYNLESKEGWFHDTRIMLKDIDSDFVFFWIEDHINMVDASKYDEILDEMKENECEHLTYSWWHNKYKKNFSSLAKKGSDSLNIYKMNKKNIKAIEKDIGHYFYIVSAVSITSSKLFKKIIHSNHPRLKRWPKETPFDFEKRSTDTEFLPFNHAVSKFELFASIDDNHLTGERYSLIDRGLYPDRMSREDLKDLEFNNEKNKFIWIKKFLPKPILKLLTDVYIFFKRIRYSINQK